jgi:hypothetical protein
MKVAVAEIIEMRNPVKIDRPLNIAKNVNPPPTRAELASCLLLNI